MVGKGSRGGRGKKWLDSECVFERTTVYASGLAKQCEGSRRGYDD